MKTSAVRQQTFPADHAVLVDHQYRPSVGSSPDTILRKALRQNKALAAEVARYRKDYCVSDAFLAEIDKRAGAAEPNYGELAGAQDQLCAQDRGELGGADQEFQALRR